MTPSEILARIALPTSFSLPYTYAVSMCRYPMSIAFFTACSPSVALAYSATQYHNRIEMTQHHTKSCLLFFVYLTSTES